MKSIALVIPFFGRLPEFFPVWRETALRNPTVDFLFFTDIADFEPEANIKAVRVSFPEFREKLQACFDFPIVLPFPYKLCDYKPVYGLALKEYLAGYDFWGNCDIDLVFGDIRRFLTDDILERYPKVLEHGHFTLYRNDPDTNTAFMRGPGYKDYDYKKTFSSPDAMYFDEFLGSMLIFRKAGIPFYRAPDDIFGVDPAVKAFRRDSGGLDNVVFAHRGSSLYALTKEGGEIREKEILYAHFLKRDISVKGFAPGGDFYIAPNRVLPGDTDLARVNFSPRGALYGVKGKLRHVREYLTRYRAGNYASFAVYKAERAAFGGDLRASKREIARLDGEEL